MVGRKTICTCISASDIGTHNIIKTKNGLKFIDFEYAGYDDTSKLAADLRLHLNYQFKKDKKSNMIEVFSTKGAEKACPWQKRYTSRKRINTAKWTMIMLRRYRNGEVTREDWNNIKQYRRSVRQKHGINL